VINATFFPPTDRPSIQAQMLRSRPAQ
jgi:hypothetical protein